MRAKLPSQENKINRELRSAKPWTVTAAGIQIVDPKRKEQGKNAGGDSPDVRSRASKNAPVVSRCRGLYRGK